MAAEEPTSGLRGTVAAGDYQESLRAVRDRLAVEAESAEGAALASVAKQLVDVLGRLEGLPVREGSTVDDLASRRADRRGTPVSDAPADGVKRGARGGGARGKRGAAS